MKTWTAIALSAGILLGCTSAEDRLFFDGQFFNTKLRKVEGQLDRFTVTVKPVSKSLSGALEAGRFEAVSYCVNNFGSSDIIWSEGPDADESTLNIQDDLLTLQGRCPNAN